MAAILAAAVPALATAASSTWTVDPAHTEAGFAVKHLVISTVRGDFNKLGGTVVLDEGDVTKSTVEVTIDAASIDTRIEKRDTHLKSADFFDVAKYPNITFKSAKVEKSGEGKLKVTGNLTIKATTKPVVLDVTGPTAEIKGPDGKGRRGFSATTKINRQEFGLTWSKTVEAGPVVGDEITIQLDGELIKADQPAAK
jgi:polyisoprenoid-binding protein YceI